LEKFFFFFFPKNPPKGPKKKKKKKGGNIPNFEGWQDGLVLYRPPIEIKDQLINYIKIRRAS